MAKLEIFILVTINQIYQFYWYLIFYCMTVIIDWLELYLDIWIVFVFVIAENTKNNLVYTSLLIC